MNIHEVIASQYLASLDMLRQAIVKCPDAMWNNPDDKAKFWHIAYHALFYTHFYLQDSQQTFTPWVKHRTGYHQLGQLPEPTDAEPHLGEPYDKASVLEYLDVCKQEVKKRVPHLDLEGESGFYWLPLDKLELQIYTIRHIQQHAGELMERLGTQADIEIDWVGMVHN